MSVSPKRDIELSVGGMTCASCSRRVERALGKLDGVTAEVNYATGTAVVHVESGVTSDQLVAAVEGSGYSATLSGKAVEPFSERSYVLRLLIGTFATIPLMAIAMSSNLQFDYWQLTCALLALPVVTWCAFPFHRAAWLNLKHRAATMDTLVSLGVIAAYGFSLWALFFTHAGMVGMTMPMELIPRFDRSQEPSLYFEVAASVTTLVLFGRYLEHRARRQSMAAIENLVALNPTSAMVEREGAYVSTPIADVKVGDRIQVAAGTQIPVDGVVQSGSGHVDSSLITGESAPIAVGPGDSVIGATVLLDTSLIIEATAVAGESVLSGISKLVHQAQMGKSKVNRLVDQVSAVFVPIVIGLAVVTGIAWLAFGNSIAQSLTAAVSVLVIACPCALGLATPTALLVGTGRGAQLGILIRGPHAIEASPRITHIFLDKTGTITTGRMTVVAFESTIGKDALWSVVGAVEAGVSHPIAHSLVEHARQKSVVRVDVSDSEVIAGSGIRAQVDGNSYAIGSVQWLPTDEQIFVDFISTHEQQGSSLVVVAQNDTVVAVVALADAIAPESANALARLHDLNITPIVVSGDHESAVAHVCAELGITSYFASCTPQRKLEIIADAQINGDVVAMVGDGVNDAAALAKAHLSLAMGAGTDVAASAADIVLMRSNLAAAVDAISLSRKTMSTIRGNLFWAFGYNAAAIPLAMLGFLSPIIASAAMAFSSVFVVTNSLRLRRFARH